MKILSLFDGISCCRVALNRANIPIHSYYASEIDKHAIKIAQKNFPDTVQLGNVLNWKNWNIDFSSIDIVTAGFPCQAWSVAGKQLGDRDERGALFWTTLDVISHIKKLNPKVIFLLENVKMKSEFETYITHHTEKALGKVNKYLINSALVSAQNRQRYYWTNIEGVQIPEDKGILLKDILENSNSKFFYLNDNKRWTKISKNSRGFRPNRGDKKKSGISELGTLLKPSSKSDSITTTHAPKIVLNEDINNLIFRKLTPFECEKLQTLDKGYTEGVSETQRYKCLGNGWTVDVIAHIFKNI